MTSFEIGTTSEVRRGPAEIQARMVALEELIAENEVWIDTGIGRVLESESRWKLGLLRAKLDELYWALGYDDSSSGLGRGR